ncbi:hypothetical protein MEBOL_001488 [Melittangium boletus DSM 14713]|uniref:Uncharacterized protein n=1 Tax=Melittangium boletus DSM 14713 TaxID=1294270 RepID=A0A250I9Z9_9BACT|nr:hypothetical protein MEBOL_001488 [Melittangium boletus DSM 14713]
MNLGGYWAIPIPTHDGSQNDAIIRLPFRDPAAGWDRVASSCREGASPLRRAPPSTG